MWKFISLMTTWYSKSDAVCKTLSTVAVVSAVYCFLTDFIPPMWIKNLVDTLAYLILLVSVGLLVVTHMFGKVQALAPLYGLIWRFTGSESYHKLYTSFKEMKDE